MFERLPQPDCYVFVYGAGVGFLFGHSKLRKLVEDLMSLHLELPG